MEKVPPCELPSGEARVARNGPLAHSLEDVITASDKWVILGSWGYFSSEPVVTAALVTP